MQAAQNIRAQLSGLTQQLFEGSPEEYQSAYDRAVESVDQARQTAETQQMESEQ